MCIECRRSPCHPMCPNAPEQEVVGVCFGCRSKIFEGHERWIDMDRNIYCCQDCAIDTYEIAEVD